MQLVPLCFSLFAHIRQTREVWDAQMFAELEAWVGSSCQPITEEHRQGVKNISMLFNF